MADINVSDEDASKLGQAFLDIIGGDLLWKSMVLAVDPRALDVPNTAALGRDLLRLVTSGSLDVAAAELQLRLAEQALQQATVERHGEPQVP